MADRKTFTVNGRTVRNLYATKDGRPRCAYNHAPYCKSRGSVAVGAFAYCSKHASAAEKALQAYCRDRPRQVIEREPNHFKTSGKSLAAYLLDDH